MRVGGLVMNAQATLAAVLLAAGVAAAVAAVTVRVTLDRVPRVASVRLGELTADFMAKTLRRWREQ